MNSHFVFGGAPREGKWASTDRRFHPKVKLPFTDNRGGERRFRSAVTAAELL